MPGVGKLKTKCCGCANECDLCGLDVFGGGDPTAETVSVSVVDFDSTGACTPSGGSGAAAVLNKIHACTWAFDLPNGCPVYQSVTNGTGAGENGTVVVIVGTVSTLCGTDHACAVTLTYNPSANLQRIYKYDSGAFVSCDTSQDLPCTVGNSTIGTISSISVV